MAIAGISSANSQKLSKGISAALASALLEWLLIFFLFIDAIFSYIITKFACYCKLQTPCLFCSRLDHVLGKERKQGYYWDLICNDHKLEISSLVLCRAHDKLVNVHGMCEGCLFSFATINKSISETYRLLVGKLGEESDYTYDQDPLLGDHKVSLSTTKHCSCCDERWDFQGYDRRLVLTKSIGSEAADQFDIQSSGAVGINFHEKKRRSKTSVSVRATDLRNSQIDPLSHVGYTELKITSDSESEVALSDDDAISTPIRETDDFKENIEVQCVQMETCIIDLDEDLASEKLIGSASPRDPSILESEPGMQLEYTDIHGSKSAAATTETGHSLEKVYWQQIESSAVCPSPSEFISFDDVPQSSNKTEVPVEVSKETWQQVESRLKAATETGHSLEKVYWQQVESSAVCPSPSEFISFDDVPQSSNKTEVPVEVSKETYDLTTGKEGLSSEQRSTMECEEIIKSGTKLTTSEAGLEPTPVSSDNGQQNPSLMDLGDAYKLVVTNRGRQLSGMLAEHWLGKDSSRISEDLKILLSQLSAARGTDLSVNDLSPRLSVNSDEVKTSDASNSAGIQILQKRVSLERNESGLSLDGSIVSEIEGESIIDRLKRQVDHDRKLMNALYKELEEERNASAVAANQALAMITRLQEEKATLHMEALQYLRMMDEQSEYEMEALQNANNLLAEKEREIEELEEELEIFRKKFPDESVLENLMGRNSDMKVKDIGLDHPHPTCIENDESILNISDKTEGQNKSLEEKNIEPMKSPLMEFEDERSYILQHLKRLEKQVYLFMNIHQSPDNGVNTENAERKLKLNLDARGDDSSTKKLPTCKENGELECDGKNSPVLCRNIDTASGSLVSDLIGRLRVLEADQSFLEHTINILSNGEEGLKLLQEIADYLRQLRTIGIREQDQPDI